MGIIFYRDKNYFLLPEEKAFNEQKIRSFCQEKGIALGDTAMEIIRLQNNASDKFLHVVTPWNPSNILSRIPHCDTIIVTGQKSLDTLLETIPGIPFPKTGNSVPFHYNDRHLTLWRLPSSSRAYPMKLEQKAEIYSQLLIPLFIS